MNASQDPQKLAPGARGVASANVNRSAVQKRCNVCGGIGSMGHGKPHRLLKVNTLVEWLNR